MPKKILQFQEKPARTTDTVQSGGVLREIAKEIRVSDIKTIKIEKILKEMSGALKSQDDGVAIAAPQIGYSLRIFVVSGKIFARDFARKRPARADGEEKLKSREEILLNENNIVGKIDEKENRLINNLPEEQKDLVFINPKISKLSNEKEWMAEGCLSVRPLYGKTFRSTKATIIAYDENGKKFQRGASGLLAQIFQHETDHLNGILFIDHAKDIKEELPK